jgi:hypothetical protein
VGNGRADNAPLTRIDGVTARDGWGEAKAFYGSGRIGDPVLELLISIFRALLPFRRAVCLALAGRLYKCFRAWCRASPLAIVP